MSKYNLTIEDLLRGDKFCTKKLKQHRKISIEDIRWILHPSYENLALDLAKFLGRNNLSQNAIERSQALLRSKSDDPITKIKKFKESILHMKYEKDLRKIYQEISSYFVCSQIKAFP